MKKLILLISLCIISLPAMAHEEKESTFDRVINTETIRCGYLVAPPYFSKDPNDGSFSGIWYEYMQELGKILDLKIEWTLEVGMGDFIDAIKSKKIDAFCSGIWNNPTRAKSIDFVTPISYQVLFAYTKEGDHRFDNNLDAINSEDTNIACLDGEMSHIIAQTDFPKANINCLPQLSPFSDVLMNIATKKADVTFTTQILVSNFNNNNPENKIRQVENAYPIRTFPESIAVEYGETQFRRMLDHATRYLIDTGKINTILTKYEKEYGSFYRTTKSYEVK